MQIMWAWKACDITLKRSICNGDSSHNLHNFSDLEIVFKILFWSGIYAELMVIVFADIDDAGILCQEQVEV